MKLEEIDKKYIWGLRVIVPIISSVLGVGGFGWIAEPVIVDYYVNHMMIHPTVVKHMDTEIDGRIKAYKESNSISWRKATSNKIHEDFRIDLSEVQLTKALAKCIYYADSIPFMLKHVQVETKYDIVAIRRMKDSGRLIYYHTDGLMYYPVRDPEYKLYYITDSQGNKIWI